MRNGISTAWAVLAPASSQLTCPPAAWRADAEETFLDFVFIQGDGVGDGDQWPRTMAASRTDHYHAAKQLGHDRKRRAIPRDFSASFMSDTKWRKLFAAMDDCPTIRRLRVKFVGVGTVRETGLPSLATPHAWAEFSEFGPQPLREIEWVEVPRDYYPKVGVVAHQDIEGLIARLSDLGQFPISEIAAGLRIHGYERAPPSR